MAACGVVSPARSDTRYRTVRSGEDDADRRAGAVDPPRRACRRPCGRLPAQPAGAQPQRRGDERLPATGCRPRASVSAAGDALEDAGLRRTLRLHDLRHTAAASWLAAGLPLILVQHQLGHASITTTQQVYGHLEESFLRGAAERVERLIWTPADG